MIPHTDVLPPARRLPARAPRPFTDADPHPVPGPASKAPPPSRDVPRRVLAALHPVVDWRDVPLLLAIGEGADAAEDTIAAGALHDQHEDDGEAQASILSLASGLVAAITLGGGAAPLVTAMRSPRAVAVGDVFQEARDQLRALVATCHGVSADAGQWRDPLDGEWRGRPLACQISRIVALLTGGHEEHLRAARDPRLPHRPVLEVRTAEAIAVLLDMAGGLRLDVAGALGEVLALQAPARAPLPGAA